MSTSLTIYERAVDTQAFITKLGDAIYRSRMFGAENEAQGIVLATTCAVKNRDPLSLTEDYHIIHDRLSMKAESMLSGFMERGGKHKVIERTANRAALELTHNGQTITSELSWEDARNEPFIYEGKEKDVVAALAANQRDKLKIKAKYMTPRSRMQMLWARAVSDGVNVICPIVKKGRYTPQEISDFDEVANGNGHVHVDPVDDDVIDGSFEVATSPRPTSQPATATQPTQSTASSASEDGYATHDQCTEIRTLYDGLGITQEQQEAALKKRGVSVLRSLKFEDAQELLEKLRAGVAKQIEEAKQHPPIDLAGPCSEEQAKKAKELIKELAQGFDPDIAGKVAAKLESCGLKKLIELSVSEIEGLIKSLEIKSMEAFFDASLRGHGQPGQQSQQPEASPS